VAVTQISRIQIRQGLASDLPVNLASGEFGLANDTGELFVGTPNLFQVANRAVTYPYFNTQVLTEFSPNVEALIAYMYQYRNASLVPQATPITSDGFNIVRRLQERLDESVSVKSYGALGDGATDDTYAIRRAAIDVTNTLSPNYQRALYFPAGTYLLTQSALITPNSNWFGDGPFNSILKLVSNFDCVAETTDGAISLADLDNPTQIGLHTRYNILLSNGLPENITIEGLHFLSASNTDIVRLFRARKVSLTNCRFEGAWVCSNKVDFSSYDYGSDSVSLFIDGLFSTPDYDNRDYSVVNCQFAQSTYGFMITDTIKDISVVNSSFENMYQGIHLGNDGIPPSTLGYLTTNPVSNLVLITGGTGYLHAPTITISGGGGTAATALATIENGAVNTLTLTNPGNSFTGVPTVTFTVFGGDPAVNSPAMAVAKTGSPSGFHVSQSVFTNIQDQAIAIYDDTQGFTSVGNRFEGVGMGLSSSCQPGINPVTPCITFDNYTQFNSSICDTFDRLAPVVPTNIATFRVYYNRLDPNIVVNNQEPAYMKSPQTGLQWYALQANNSSFVNSDIVFNVNGDNLIYLEYIIRQPNAINPGNTSSKVGLYYRMGTLRILQDTVNVVFDETYYYLNGPDDITFNVVINGSEVTLQYTNNSAYDAQIYINTRHFNV
jgi:hypothetical protein